MTMDRRNFLGTLGGGLAAAASPISNVLAFGSAKRPFRGGANKLVIANMLGGWDTLSVVIPHGTFEYGNRRPTIAVPAPDPLNPLAALPLEPGIGLHPGLAAIHPLYAAGDLMVVHKVGYPGPNLSHFTSQDIMSRGIRDLSHPDSRGWLGRLGDLYFGQALQIVGLRTGNKIDFRANTSRPVAIDDLASFRVPGNPFDANDSGLRNDIARQILDISGTNTGLVTAVQESGQSMFSLVDDVGAAVANYTSNVVYPESSLGRSFQDVARLIQGQLPTQVFYVQRGGFDDHSGLAGGLAARLPDVGTSLAAFVADLQAMNEWDNTTVIVISEFGRRNYENGSQGTDHGQALHFLLLGGGLAGGLRGTPVSDTNLLPGSLAMETDFRQVYFEVLQSRFNIDPSPIFPAWTPPGSSLNLF